MFEKVCEILADKFDADASTMTMEIGRASCRERV